MICEAAANYGGRYTSFARQIAEAETDITRKTMLLEIAEVCQWVPALPTWTFREAIQSVWILQLHFHLDLLHPSISFGQLDQYTYPLFF
jgi:pyruvate-formate lyase